MFLIDPFLQEILIFLSNNLIYCFFVGIVMGMIFVDFAYSVHLGMTIKKAAKSMQTAVNFENFKQFVKEKYEAANGKRKSFGDSLKFFASQNQIELQIREQQAKEKLHRWWKKEDKNKE